VREPFVCAGCGVVDPLAHGLCADCAARDAAILDLDPDQAIPFELTPRAYAVLATSSAPRPSLNNRSTPTPSPVTAQDQHGHSGEAACPRCGRVRGVVYDGEPTRCYGCWHRWVPQRAPTPSVA
jgi:hypothetical protein